MLSYVAMVALAALMLAAGIVSGWLIRGHGRMSMADGSELPERRVGGGSASRPAAEAGRARKAIDDEAAAPCVRNTFSLALGHRLAESTRYGDPLSVILVRIDNYREFRDCHGLQAGNEILEAVGKFFIASVRTSDWVARFDVTTFALLLPKTAHANALIVAERLRTTVASARLAIDGTPVSLTLSVGIAESALGDCSDDLIRRAEEAMNASILNGGNRIHGQARGTPEAACAG